MRAGGPGWRDWHARTQRRHRRRSLMRIGAEHERARIEGMLMGLAMRDALDANGHSPWSWYGAALAGRDTYREWIPAIRAVRGEP